MGKRKKHNDLNAGGVPTPVEDEGMVGAEVKVKRGMRNRSGVTASVVKEADMMAERESLDAVVTAGEGRKRMNRSSGKRSAGQSKEETSSEGGEAGAKATFSWTSAKEIVVLSELVELANGHTGGKSGTDWVQLAATVGERLGYRFTRIQIYEKVRRLRERYTKIHNKEGKINSFKNDDDEKMYTLSHLVWGTTEVVSPRPKEVSKRGKLNSPKSEKLPKRSKQAKGPLGALRLHLEEERDLAPGEVEKQVSDQNNKDEDEITSPNHVEVTPRGSGFAHPSEPNQGTTAADGQPQQSKAQHAFEGDIQKTIEVFRAEHQAVLKELEKRCAMVVEDMQTKLLSMMSKNVRGSQFPWIGGTGGNVPSFGIVTEVPFMWDKLVDNCLLTSTNKPAALENLYEQWQLQRLQELKLMSMRLHLMLEDCKMEQEKLEKQVVKPK